MFNFVLLSLPTDGINKVGAVTSDARSRKLYVMVPRRSHGEGGT
jgi:hypothetical protein